MAAGSPTCRTSRAAGTSTSASAQRRRPRVHVSTDRRRVAVLVGRRQHAVLQRQRPDDGVGVRMAPELSASAPIIVPGADAMVLAGGATAGDRVLVRQAGAAPAGRAELRVVLEWFTELTKPHAAGLTLAPDRSHRHARRSARRRYRHIADPDRLLELGLFVAEGRLVVRRLLDLQHWAIESILLTRPRPTTLVDVLPLTNAPIYLVDQARDERHRRLQHSSRLPGARAGGRRRRRSIASPPARCRACWCWRASTIPTTSADCSAAPRRSASSWSCSARTAAIRSIARPIRTSMGATLSVPFVAGAAVARRDRRPARRRLHRRRA